MNCHTQAVQAARRARQLLASRQPAVVTWQLVLTTCAVSGDDYVFWKVPVTDAYNRYSARCAHSSRHGVSLLNGDHSMNGWRRKRRTNTMKLCSFMASNTITPPETALERHNITSLVNHQLTG
jgi:hypothetical protein